MSHETWREYKKTMPTIWDTELRQLQHNQSLYHKEVILRLVVYTVTILWIWEIDHNRDSWLAIP